MKKRILYILFPLLLASCSFLDEKNTTYATSDYYTSPERIVTGLNGCYDPVRSIYSAAMLQMTECATDVMFLSSYTRPDANCVISPAKPCHGKTVWKQGYLGVMRTNELCGVINRTLEEGKITEDEYATLEKDVQKILDDVSAKIDKSSPTYALIDVPLVKIASTMAGGLPYIWNIPLSEMFIFSTLGDKPYEGSLTTHSGGATKRRVLYFLVTDEIILRASINVDLPALFRPTRIDVPLNVMVLFS